LLTRRAAMKGTGAALVAPSVLRAEVPLRLGFLPTERAPDLLRRLQPFLAAFETAYGRPVSPQVATDYAAAVEALRFGHVDIGLLGPAAFLLLQNRAPVTAIVRTARGETDSFRAALIAPAGGIGRIEDIRGREILFGDTVSTSGHVVPRYMLAQRGLVFDRDYSARFLGGHDAVIYALSAGHAAAGAVSEPIFERFVAEGRIERAVFRQLALSDPIPTYPWVAGPTFGADGAAELRATFLSLPAGPALDVFGADRFIPPRPGDFDQVAAALGSMDLLD